MNMIEKITKIEDIVVTPREKDVIELLCEGFTYKEIAKMLFISETTVKTHINNIMPALGVNEKHQIVVYVKKYGFPDVGSRKKVNIEEVKKLISQSLSVGQIQERLKISCSTINRVKSILIEADKLAKKWQEEQSITNIAMRGV